MVLHDDQYGFINTQGEYVIEPQYALARSFSDGVACVNIGGQRNNGIINGVLGGKYQFINTKNEVQFDGFTSVSPMSFFNKVAVITNDDMTKSLLTSQGKIVAKDFSVIDNCKEGLLPAMNKKEKKLGYINKKGEWALALPYENFIGPFSEGLSAFTESKSKLNGYLNKKGLMAIPAKYKSAADFSNGLARVIEKENYFFIDKKGKQAFKQEFENAGDFKNGLCPVQKKGQWGFIDKTGKLVIDYQAVKGVREYNDDRIAFKNDEGVGYMDGTGKVVIKPQFDNGLSFKNGYAIIEQNGKIGFIDLDGNIIIKPQYTRAGNFVDPNKSNKIIKVN